MRTLFWQAMKGLKLLQSHTIDDRVQNKGDIEIQNSQEDKGGNIQSLTDLAQRKGGENKNGGMRDQHMRAAFMGKMSALDCIKLQRGPFEHPSTSRITIRFVLELAGKPYDLPAISNTSRLADVCSEDPCCVFSGLDCVKLQRGSSEYPSASRITIRLALELADKPYDLPASSNVRRITKRFADGCSKGPRCVFSDLNCVKLQREPFEHTSASRITIRIALELAGKPCDLPTISNASRLTIRLADVCSEDPHCIFSALDCVKLQRGSSEHTSANHITIRLALEFVGNPYDLPASFNVRRITKRLADGYSKDPRCVLSALDCVKLQRGPFEHPLASCITIRLALELVGKPYDLPASSNARQLTIRFVDVCSEGPRCIFSALDYVKLQRKPSEHLSASCITIHLVLKLAGKPYDLPTSSNAKRIIKRLADGCSEGSRCVFSALDCIKLQRGPFEHPSASRITIRFVLELAGKPYDLPAISNTNRLADVCSEDPCCVFSGLDCVKLQRGSSEYPSASRITIRLALELADKPYDLPARSNVRRITKRFADGCSKGPRCVFSDLDCVKLQREPFEHTSASRITIRIALELAGKTCDLPTISNASRLTIRLADVCSEDPHCIFSALDCVKLQRGSSEHTSANHITIRLALEFVGNPYDLPASFNVRRITKRLADGYSKDPRCVLSALDCVKLQRGPFEHPLASCITIRLALELVGKPYDLPASSNARQLTIRFVDVCSEGPRCIFSALDYVKLQRKPSEHLSASCITIHLVLKLAGKPYDLPTSSNAKRIIKRLADGCSEGSRCVFSALHCIKLQRGPFEHPSASRITIRFALELAGKPYDLPAISNTSRLADVCSEDPCCVFSGLDCVKLQRGSSEYPSASRITIRLALELADKPYDLPASSNVRRITKRFADGCSKGPRCVFSDLDCVKLQREPFEHPSASRITIRIALKLADKTCDLPTISNASRLTIRLADVCSEDPHCIFSALDCVKLQRGSSEHTSVNHITIRLALELVGKPYDLPASFNVRRITKRLADGCSKDPRCVLSALDCVKLQRGPFEHPLASCITIRLALELVGKPYDLPASSNAKQLTIRFVDVCSEGPRCIFSALDYVKLQRKPSEHLSASCITIHLVLKLAGKPYDLPTSSNAKRIIKRLADGCSEGPRCVFSALDYVKLQCGL
ncbi:hypothetical protein L7F22_027586 [Adiantum nelumboides]|nr:hypothetical protein [Adiantum nelumboides]